MSLIAKKLLTCFVLFVFVLAGAKPMFAQAEAQQAPEAFAMKAQPPMKNVFMNVLWGSFTGGLLLMGWATLDDSIPSEDRFKFSRLTEQFLVGATYGGILGMGAGIYLSIRGITFDQNRSRIAFYPDYRNDPAGQRFFATSKSVNGKGSINLLNIHYKF